MLNFLFDKKGQAGSVFKLLIGAVIGVAIVAIIIVVIQIMGSQKTYLTEEVFSNKIIMAMKNPTGNEYKIEDLYFEANKVITKKALAEKTGLAESCITLEVNETAQSYVSFPEPKNYILFKKQIKTDVGVTCILEDSGAEICDILCTLTVYGRGG